MVALPPPQNPTVDAIYANYEIRQRKVRAVRKHLGASVIGRPCPREIWYMFRSARYGRFEGRILRLFDHGNVEENRVIKDLRRIGYTVQTRDPETKRQYGFKSMGGHFAGSYDGIVEGLLEAPKTPHLLEVKTSNDRLFKLMVKDGVRVSKPEHYVQMQIYMSKANLTRAVYIVVNKNTEHIHLERVKYDEICVEKYTRRARQIITTRRPPPKLSEDPGWWQCKWCDYQDICHGGDCAEFNCRTCKHSIPALAFEDPNRYSHSKKFDAQKAAPIWLCERHMKVITPAKQRTACKEHTYLAGMSMPVTEPLLKEPAPVSSRPERKKKAWER